MIRITKITDHGIVLLTRFAGGPPNAVFNARDLAREEGMSLPMVSKILKILAGGNLLRSHRGVKGGYSLARSPENVTLAEIVTTLEGPIALTDCSTDMENGMENGCHRGPKSPARPHWRIINQVIRDSLKIVTLEELATPDNNQDKLDKQTDSRVPDAPSPSQDVSPKSPETEVPFPKA